MAKTPEGEVQAYGAEQLKKHGCLVRKISYEGRRGCPDQLVLVPKRARDFPAGIGYTRKVYAPPSVIFVEYKKAEDIEPDPHQVRERIRMQKRGADVRVIGSRQQVDALIQELFPS